MGLKKNVKVLVSLLLILVLCIQLVPVTDVYAGYEFPMATGNGWFLLDDGSLFLIDDINNPSIYGEDLTPWFKFKDKITSVYAYTGSSIDNCNSLFEGCKNVTSIDISRLNTSKVEDMYHMFYGCSKLTELNITGIDTSNVTDMESMFNGCRLLVNLDVSGFNTAKANAMSGMFSYCTKLKKIDVSNFSNAN